MLRPFRRRRTVSEPGPADRGAADRVPADRTAPDPPSSSVWARAAADSATAHGRLTALVPGPLPPGPLGPLLDRARDVSGRALDRIRAAAAAGAARWPDTDLATPSDPAGRAAHDRLRELVRAHRDLAHRVGLLTVGVPETEQRFLVAGVTRAADALDGLLTAPSDGRGAGARPPDRPRPRH